MQKLREGVIGDVYMARGLCFKWRDTIGKKPTVPSCRASITTCGWGLRQRPFNPNRFHYNWHWNWDYGNGDIGNQGIHEMDICRWGSGREYKVFSMVAILCSRTIRSLRTPR